MSAPFLDAWRLDVSTLGPVHIGTGDDYDPTGYVIDGPTLYAFDAAGAARALPAPERARLLSIVNGRPGVAMLRQVQALFHANRERLVAEASHAVPVAVGVSAFYADRIGQTAQREESGLEIVNRLGIARTYSDRAGHSPVLLGSSLKGAIRTALLDRVNGGGALTAEERALLDGPKDRDRARAHRKLQERLFRYRPGRFELDPMRLVHLSDAPYTATDGLPGTEIRFAVNRKKHAVILAGQEVRSQAEQSNLQQILETALPMRFRAFTGGLTVHRPVDVQGGADKVPSAALRWSVDQIAAACNRFYWPRLEQEVEALRGRGFLEDAWLDSLESLLRAGLKQRLDAGRAFLLRVGRHSGAECVTLDGVRHVKIMRRKGEPPEHGTQARTWWLAAPETADRRNLVPFGWVVLELTPAGEEPAPWLAASDVDTRYNGRLAAWRDDLAERRRTLGLQRAEEARRLAEEQEKRRAAEAAAREREQRRAAMTAEARQVDDLRALFDRDRDANRREPGGHAASQLAGLLREADGWPASDRQALADLAMEMYTYLGWGNSAKKKERKERLAQLLGSG
jgi:CRISPR-associated protein Csm5